MRPGYTIAAVLTIALGIAATTSVFSIASGVLFTALPYQDAHQLVRVAETNGLGRRTLSYPTFEDWRAESQEAFESLAYAYGRTPRMLTDDGPVLVPTAYVSDDFFRTLGAAPLFGKTSTGGATAAVVSHDFWVRRLGGGDAVEGRIVTLDSITFTIVGVMSPTFISYPNWAQVWVPIDAVPAVGRRALAQRDRHADSWVVGRLRDDVSLERARVIMSVAAERHAAAYPEFGEGWTGVWLQKVRDEVLGDAPRRIGVFGIAVALMLLLACVNVAGLALARATTRSREFAIRLALGAGLGRVARMLLTESAILSLVGGVLGVYLAWGGVRYLKSSAPGTLPRLDEVGIDIRVLAFAMAVVLVTAIIAGVFPALGVKSTDTAGVLRSGAATAGPRRSESRLRSAFVTAELAVALTLIITSGLLLKSVLQLQAVDPGFDAHGLVTARIEPPPGAYQEPDALINLYQRLADAVERLPSVESVALTNHFPLGGGSMPTRLIVRDQDAEQVLFRTVSPGYFSTMQIPLVRGREFETSDLDGGDVVLVNRAMAERYWGEENTIGRSLTVFKSVQDRPDFGEPIQGAVAGVVNDVHHFRLERPPVPEVYLPYTANPPTWIFLVARTSGATKTIVEAIRRQLLAIEPGLPTEGTLGVTSDRLSVQTASREFTTTVVAGFAFPSLFLAAVGIWGVIALAVVQRRREIGIRVALGAKANTLPWHIAIRSAGWIAAGLVIGLVGAYGLGHFMTSLLFEVDSADLPVFALGTLVMVIVALLATYVPARRASTVDPIAVLRGD